MADSDIVRLTQGQIKMIGDKIKEAGGEGGITTLTADDYNYPENNPTGIALWKLSSGVYKITSGTKYVWDTSISTKTREADLIVIIGQTTGGYTNIVIFGDACPTQYMTRPSTGGAGGVLSSYDNANLVTFRTVVDNLTSTSSNRPLSANQGKVLNDKIGGNLSNLTTTDKTSLIAAINELNTRLSALEGN